MSANSENKRSHPDRRSRILGCMLGGAVGDALGASVELASFAAIRKRFGSDGICRFEDADRDAGAITSLTQMSLFTAEGLILARIRADYDHGGKALQAIYHAYVRWLATQDRSQHQQLINSHGTCAVIDGILTGHPGLYARRSPADTCLAALQSGRMGTMDEPINHSKGCGGVTRAAPIGLAIGDADHAFRLGAQSAAITHGHPDGYLAAGCLSAMTSRIADGSELTDAVSDACRILKRYPEHNACLKAIQDAIDLSAGSQFSPDRIEILGAGWVAEEALAIGLCCCMAARGTFRQGVLMAVNHSGSSHATGSIAGNLLGAWRGIESIPVNRLEHVDLKAVIEEMATDLFDQYGDG